ncbi:MAG: 3-deoxy-8-phosphooctulonate synthase [Actinomycetota bacterium]|nr:3-deoxy-8-phosphooctulonate synthase [Actinomycetota bacterium]
MTHSISIGDRLVVGRSETLALVGGPCVIEDRDSTIRLAERIRDLCLRAGVGFVFKASFDKANRSSIDSFRGPGLDAGLAILRDVRDAVGVAVLTDIHESWQAEPVASVVDVLQIPAFLCRQTDLVTAAAATGKPVNIKKGQFVSPFEMANVVRKAEAHGNRDILLTERGTTFGYNNLVVDFRSLPLMRDLGYPVVFDATHSVQTPGGAGNRSGGQREFVTYLARAAVAVGVDALFIEIHDDPDSAPSDGPNMLRLDDLEALLREVVAIWAALAD